MRTKPRPRSPSFRAALVLASLVGHCGAYSQPGPTGTIAGRVSNPGAGSFLAIVRVVVEGTAIEDLTNEAGEFLLADVPAGEATVRVSYASFERQVARVQVAAGQTVMRNFELAPPGRRAGATADAVVMLDAFTLVERELSAQAAAIQVQRTAANIKNVVAFEEFGDLGDGNTGDFLKFVPGLFLELGTGTPSDPSIRGMPASGTLLTVDGVELSSDTPTTRNPGFQSTNTCGTWRTRRDRSSRIRRRSRSTPGQEVSPTMARFGRWA